MTSRNWTWPTPSLDVEVAYKEGKGSKDNKGDNEQYHPKVREAVENSQR